MECCNTCKFCRTRTVKEDHGIQDVKFVDVTYFECHRCAPHNNGKVLWPEVEETDWCGEYEPNNPLDQFEFVE